MMLSEKYELGELISSGDVQTYRAKHRTLGQALMIHIVSEGSPQKVRLLKDLSRLADTDKDLFTDVGEDGVICYLVSRDLPDFDNLPAWMTRRLIPSVSSGFVPKTSSQQTAVPGEFTRFFQDIKQKSDKPRSDTSDFSKWFPSPVAPNGQTERSQGASIDTPAAQQKPPVNVGSSVSEKTNSGLRASEFPPTDTVVIPVADGLDRPGRVAEKPARTDFSDRRTEAGDFNSDLFDDPLPPATASDHLNDGPTARRPPDENSYTQVITPKDRKAPSPSPVPPAGNPPATQPVHKNEAPSERWYWVSIVVLAILAFAIVVFFAVKA